MGLKFRKEILPFVEEVRFPTLSHVFRDDGVGRTIPIPMPVVKGNPDRIYTPMYYLGALIALRRSGSQRLQRNLVYVPDMDLVLHFHYFHAMSREYSLWTKYYRPPPGLGGVVLDAGAGCGETAYLFFALGAREVISIEPNPTRYSILERNAKAHHWNIRLINDRLRDEHLDLEFDFAKIDIEGAETQLLGLERLPPCVIEVHDDEVRDAFVRRFRFHTVWTNHHGLSLIRNI